MKRQGGKLCTVSDNGTNFNGTEREVAECFATLNRDE